MGEPEWWRGATPGYAPRGEVAPEELITGPMNGCVLFGRSGEPPLGDERPNTIRDNDFTQVRFTDNVAWRASFPLQAQRWPEGFTPLVDDEHWQS